MRPKTSENPPKASAEYQGFSFIELMVVLLILAILATIVFPSYFDSIRKAKRAEGRAALVQLMQQQERYYSQHASYAEFSSLAPNGYKWYSGGTPASSAYEIVASACKDDTLQNCVLLTAKPGTKKVDAAFRDDTCGELTLSSNGLKSASGRGAQCW
jgi:type IV pilus assembly protein PilE